MTPTVLDTSNLITFYIHLVIDNNNKPICGFYHLKNALDYAKPNNYKIISKIEIRDTQIDPIDPNVGLTFNPPF